MVEADFLVIGAGMAGASIAFELANHSRVVVLEREAWPGVHATGRSAALYAPRYGNAVVRTLTAASAPFFAAPPQGFPDAPVVSPRGTLFIATDETLPALKAIARDTGPGLIELSFAAARELVPVLRPEACVAALLDEGTADIDVDLLHQGYLRGLKARGGQVVSNVELTTLGRDRGAWLAQTAAGPCRARVVVNAAGAWADEVAGLAGLPGVGLRPKRRTVALVDPPTDLPIADWPFVSDAAEAFYFKPDAGRVLVSPADETDSPPCDAQADEYDVAVAIDHLQNATTLEVRRVTHRWAGLRTFAADRTPVCGYDPRAEGFFWLAGQGGYGIQIAPALARIAASLAMGRAGDDRVLVDALRPGRLFEAHSAA